MTAISIRMQESGYAIEAESNQGSRDLGRRNLEIQALPRSPLFRPNPRRGPGEPASLHLRSASPGSGHAARGGLASNARAK